MKSALVVVFALLSCVHATTVAMGTGVSCSGGVTTAVTWQALPAFNFAAQVYTDVTTTVTLATYGSTITFPASDGYQQLQIAGNAGFQLSSSVSTANVQVILSLPPLDPTVYALLVVGVDAGFVQFNAASSTYVRLPINQYSSTTYQLSVTLPSTGIYLFAAISQTVTYPVSLGVASTAKAAGQSNQTYVWQYNNGGVTNSLSIRFSSAVQNQITVTPRSNSSYSTVGFGANLNVFFDISLLTPAPQSSRMTYHYAQSQLTAVGYAAANLHFAVYSTASSTWTFPSGYSQVDTTNQLVIQDTTSFSQWAVFVTSAAHSIKFSPTLLIAGLFAAIAARWS